ncbi:MAG: HAMP domain-containing sensor histidine kinase [Candidatus Omnitrophota bacterium]
MAQDYTELERTRAELTGEIDKRKKAEEEKEELLQNASLFVKELNCLFGLAEVVERYKDALDDIFKNTATLLPIAWQYPDVTCAKIVFREKEFKTDDFKSTEWRQVSDIMVSGEKVGCVEVCYLEKRPEKDEGPFLREERKLIGAVAERLGRVIERKETQEALARAKKQVEENYAKLQELEKLKDSLTHMIVHDLNNPIMITSGNIELLKMQSEENLTKDQKECLDSALLASQEIKEMVGNLLDVNKMEEGKIKLNCESFSVGDVAKKTVLQMKIIATRDDKTLSLAELEETPPISADKELIRRVIANLINNAIKFTPSNGSIDVSVLNDKEKGRISVHVKDSGSGIPKDYLSKIFDKFVRVESQKVKTGRGLGLTFCKMAVEAHGGKIWVESELGKGSVFIFVLPCDGK